MGELLTRAEVAETLRVGTQTVAKWAKDGKFPQINVGSEARPTWLVDRADLEAFIQSRKETAA